MPSSADAGTPAPSVPPAPASGVEWLEVELRASSQLESELDVLLTRRDLGGWVVEAEEPELAWVFYLPCESGWKERLGSLALAVNELGGEVRVRRTVADEDWAENWKAFYHPRRLGRPLVVPPSWEDFQAGPEDRVLTLDPGMAFGTGYHASTELCLELSEEHLLARPAPTVLDVGVGSGILSIAALLLGAAKVTAVDLDPVAVRVARENLERNGLAGRARVLEARGVPGGRYHLVLANLVATVLVDLAPDLARALEPGGRLVAGGIVVERRDDVVEALVAAGLVLEAEREREAWVGLRMLRPE